MVGYFADHECPRKNAVETASTVFHARELLVVGVG